MKKSKKALKIILCIILVCIICLCVLSSKNKKTGELKPIKSEAELYRIYNGNDYDDMPIWAKVLTLPVGIWMGMANRMSGTISSANLGSAEVDRSFVGEDAIESTATKGSFNSSSTTTKDYSTTNIQVENVDEADITKTDGDYIYSLSEDKVVITDVRNPQDVRVITKFNSEEEASPVDLILNGNMLAVISQVNSYSDTYVSVYDISDRENPRLQKSYSVKSAYYTSRCINNKLYVISNGYLKSAGKKKIDREYTEDNQTKEIPLKNIKYMQGNKSSNETIITVTDLANIKEDIKINAYLLDVTNAYVSENNMYLTDYSWKNNDVPTLQTIYGLKGIFGLIDFMNDYDYSSKKETEIYKFSINDGELKYVATTKIDGQTINQYSMDEKEGHLRIATYDSDGTSISVLDEKLNLIGETPKMAKGETMYSSRFIGNKAYLITYKTIDPLFVVDLSNETKPKVLGELKISGYSAYLHPYDENHLIGIGMETKTSSNRDINGRVTSTSTRVVGMKMALFDVSDVSNPVAISTTVIGDSRTTSAILSNPKALLFSKERELLAIPVNNYTSDFEISDYDDYSSVISSYKNYSRNYTGEGYAVYKINLEDGFKLKGLITHEKSATSGYNTYSYYYKSQMLRGIYIDNNLYTVSEDEIKVNDIETMKEISNAKIINKVLYNNSKTKDIVEVEDEYNSVSNSTIQNENSIFSNNVVRMYN